MTARIPRVVIIGGSFAGLTAAYEVRVTVIDKNDQFVFIPSLIWVPFGWRTAKQISFPLRRSLERKSAEFLQAARRIDASKQGVEISLLETPDQTIPDPWAHWGKLLFERYYMWKMRTGRVNWP